MKIKEIIIEYGATRTRFQKQSNSAIFNGKPADPKKILIALKNSLNKTTGFNFKVKPTRVNKKEYAADFYYEDGDFEYPMAHGAKWMMIVLTVSWFENGSKEKPIIKAQIHNSHDEMTLFKHQIEMNNETISNMWIPMTVHTIHEYIDEEETYYDDDWNGD